MTLIPWSRGEHSCATVVDALAPFRINAGDIANSGDATPAAEVLKAQKYTEITQKSYIFQPVAFEAKHRAPVNVNLTLLIF